MTPLASSLDTVGPLARSVADVAAVYAAIAGLDPSDPWSAPVPATVPERSVGLSGLRIAILAQWNRAPTTAATRRSINGLLDALSRLGAKVEQVDEPELTLTEAARNGVFLEILAEHGDRWSAHPERYGSDVAERLRGIESVPASHAEEAARWEERAVAALRRLFRRFDVIATPTVGSTRKVIGTDDVDVDGEAIPHRAVLAPYTWPVNRVGNPALALPVPRSGSPPASLQLIGGRFGEERLLAVGLALDATGLTGVETPPIYLG